MKNQENMTEKQFLRIMNRSVICIVVCILALIRTSWAWYELSIMSANQIGVGAFEAQITVYDGEQPIMPENGIYRLESGEYLLLIDTSGSIVSGQCQIYSGETCLESAHLPPNDTVLIPLTLPESPEQTEHTVSVLITVDPDS